MNEEQLDVLLVRLAADELSAAEMESLSEELDRSPVARAKLVGFAGQVVALAGAAKTMRSAKRAAVHESWRPVSEAPRRWLAVTWALVGMAMLLFAIIGWPELTSREYLVEVIEADGAATWSSLSKPQTLAAGMRLAAGWIEVESDTGHCEVQFRDGTRATLRGGSGAMISESSGKLIRLRGGTLEIQVVRQPADRPLRIQTGAAEMVALGTKFLVEAVPAATHLRVAEGRVRLRRLSDGRQIEVGADEQAAATLMTDETLLARPRRMPGPEWTSDWAIPPKELVGVWLPAEAGQPVRLAATPMVERRNDNGQVVVHYGIVVRASDTKDESELALLKATSRLRVTWRWSRPAPIQFIVSTRAPDGSFSGNFELIVDRPDQAESHKWQITEVALRDFTPLHPRRSSEPAGTLAAALVVTTLQTPVNLEISELTIVP